jgi:hypothetical protein
MRVRILFYLLLAPELPPERLGAADLEGAADLTDAMSELVVPVRKISMIPRRIICFMTDIIIRLRQFMYFITEFISSWSREPNFPTM